MDYSLVCVRLPYAFVTCDYIRIRSEKSKNGNAIDIPNKN